MNGNIAASIGHVQSSRLALSRFGLYLQDYGGPVGFRTVDSHWRNRIEFLRGRPAIEAFPQRAWEKEFHYRLVRELRGFRVNRMAVRFAYEWHDEGGQWFGSYGDELWKFDDTGLMHRTIASINDDLIAEGDRRFHWPLGRRPEGHPCLSDLGF